MKLRSWGNWGIAARLLAIALVPAMVMFVAVTGALYVSAQGDVRRDVADRGRLIATALAQSAQYGLMSGNVSYLRTTLQQLLGVDRSIACIDIADQAGRAMVSACQPKALPEATLFEVPVRIESLPEADLMDLAGAPPGHEADAANPKVRTIGHVRVTMSAAPIFQAKRSALLAASGLVLAAAVLSSLIGLQLAKRLRQTFASVMDALRAIRKGEFDVKLNTTRDDELGELQRAITAMAGTLDAARHDLEQQVATRTQELQQAVDRVQQADAEKRRLIVHSNALVEEDRKRIALEIHDHLGAALISVRLEAAALVARAEAMGDADMARGARRISTTAESLYSSTRNIVKSLRPEVIDTLGLSGAVEELVRSFDKIHPDCRFTFSADADLPELHGEQAMPAYRVAQEALTNIVKHSKATQASVQLMVGPDREHLRIVITDNGNGFDARAKAPAGFGLIGMRERLAAVGGDMSVTSSPGQGTCIAVTLPLAREGG